MKLLRILALSAVVLVAVGGLGKLAFTASNSVAASSVGSFAASLGPAELAPSLCQANGIAPTVIRLAGNGNTTGNNSAELIVTNTLVTKNVTIDGKGGNDCIVAGAVSAGRTITMKANAGGTTACIAGPGPGNYVYGAGCDIHG